MSHTRRCVIIGNPEHKRVDEFQLALAKRGWPLATVIPYLDILRGNVSLVQDFEPGTLVRIESPGQNFHVERELLALGADHWDQETPPTYSREAALRLEFERGRILAPRQWYLGYRRLLEQLGQAFHSGPPVKLLSSPAEIAVMFDKPASQARFVAASISVPNSIGPIRNYDELISVMKSRRQPRVFVKLAHGSSASGVVAFATNWKSQKALTTVELVRTHGEIRLYNSRRLCCYENLADITAIIDTLCAEQTQVEAWVPKASLDGKTFDLRVLVINGTPQHIVIRESHSPLTNLHLKNSRGHLSGLLARISPAHWQHALQSCSQAAACFPGTFSAGVDLLITPDFRRHLILEINAFGDLLPGITCGLRNSYEAQVAALEAEEFDPAC